MGNDGNIDAVVLTNSLSVWWERGAKNRSQNIEERSDHQVHYTDVTGIVKYLFPLLIPVTLLE